MTKRFQIKRAVIRRVPDERVVNRVKTAAAVAVVLSRSLRAQCFLGSGRPFDAVGKRSSSVALRTIRRRRRRIRVGGVGRRTFPRRVYGRTRFTYGRVLCLRTEHDGARWREDNYTF